MSTRGYSSKSPHPRWPRRPVRSWRKDKKLLALTCPNKAQLRPGREKVTPRTIHPQHPQKTVSHDQVTPDYGGIHGASKKAQVRRSHMRQASNRITLRPPVARGLQPGRHQDPTVGTRRQRKPVQTKETASVPGRRAGRDHALCPTDTDTPPSRGCSRRATPNNRPVQDNAGSTSRGSGLGGTATHAEMGRSVPPE